MSDTNKNKVKNAPLVESFGLRTITFEPSANITFICETPVLGAAETDSVWRIRRISKTGFKTIEEYASPNPGVEQPSRQFEFACSDRASFFGDVPFDNVFSLQLSGQSDQYLLITDSGDIDFINTAAFSMGLWVKTTNGIQDLLHKGTSAAGNNGYRLYMDTSGRVLFEFRDGSGTRIRVRTDSLSPTIENGSWRFIMVTKASGSNLASTVKVYVDGVSEVLNVLNDSLPLVTTSATALAIGANNAGGSRLDGNVDEVAIWGVELTAAEVLEVFNSNAGVVDLQSGSGQIASGLNAWWRMGDGTFSALPTIPDEQGTNDATTQSAVTSGDLETEVPP